MHAVGGEEEREAAGLALAVVGGGARGGEGAEQALVVLVRWQEAVLVQEEAQEVTGRVQS